MLAVHQGRRGRPAKSSDESWPGQFIYRHFDKQVRDYSGYTGQCKAPKMIIGAERYRSNTHGLSLQLHASADALVAAAPKPKRRTAPLQTTAGKPFSITTVLPQGCRSRYAYAAHKTDFAGWPTAWAFELGDA